MQLRKKLPVIYLAFANEQRGSANQFLRNLKVEREAIRNIFEDAVMDEELELVIDPDVTQANIFQTFQGQRYRDRIAIFHYGGHADSDELHVEIPEGGNEPMFSAGLASLFEQQISLNLVFLNGCATALQAQLLLKANVPVVIATSRKIPDADATLFSQTFYRGIAGNATIARAFKEAESAIVSRHGSLDSFRAVYWEDTTETTNPDEVPWKLFYLDEKATEWRINPQIEYGTGASLIDMTKDMIGRQIGNYKITDYIDVGVSGFVYKAAHVSIGKEVAIKISHRIIKGYEHVKSITETAGRGLLSLNHPNIARIEDVGEIEVDHGDKRFYILMELVKGERLDKWMIYYKSGRKKDFKKLINQAMNILEGLKSAHETIYQDDRGFTIVGVWHGNIKTRKIILTETGVPKLIDFMFTDVARRKDVQLEIPVSVQEDLLKERLEDYFAPEQIKTGGISPLTDIYSIGAVLFEVFSGKRISEVPTFTSPEDVEKYLNAYNESTPDSYADIIYKATRLDPVLRFSSVRMLLEEIRNQSPWWEKMLMLLGFKRM